MSTPCSGLTGLSWAVLAEFLMWFQPRLWLSSRWLGQVTRGCCRFLLTWQLGSERENSKLIVSRDPGVGSTRMSLLSYASSQSVKLAQIQGEGEFDSTSSTGVSRSCCIRT